MPATWHRRTLLATAGLLALAGCSVADSNDRDLPDACPLTQGLEIEWPATIDASSVEPFVERYERAYYRDHVLDSEPSSMGRTDVRVRVAEGPTEAEVGYTLTVRGGGAIYTPTLRITATVAEVPADADVVPADEVDKVALNSTISDAVENGTAEYHLAETGDPVERHVESLAALSADFEPLSEPGDADTLYVDADGVSVEVTARATEFHGDLFWQARYYVDDSVIRRVEGTADPANGQLIECRMSN